MKSLENLVMVFINPVSTFKKLEKKPFFMIPFILLIFSFLVFSVFHFTNYLLYEENAYTSSNTELQEEIMMMKEAGMSQERIEGEIKIMTGQEFSESEKQEFKKTLEKEGLSDLEIYEELKEIDQIGKEEPEFYVQPPGTVTIQIITSTIISSTIFIAILAIASLFFYFLTLLFKSKKPFVYSLSLVAFSWAPFIIRYFWKSVGLFSAKYNSLSASGLAGVFGVDRFNETNSVFNTFLYAFLERIDLFAIWSVILSVIGLAIIYKLSYKKSILINLGYFLFGGLLAGSIVLISYFMEFFVHMPIGISGVV